MNLPVNNLAIRNKPTPVLGGILWITFANLVTKIGGVIVQLILAWLLSTHDFGVYAIAMSASALLLGLRNGGTDQLLIQKRSQFSYLSPFVLSYSALFNLAAAGVICLLAFPAATYYKEPELTRLMPLIALTLIVAIYAPVVSAQLSIQENYQSLSKFTTQSILLKHSLTIVFALIGFGVYAFIIPLLIQPLLFCYLSRHAISYFPRPARLNLAQTKSLFNESKWLIFSNLSNQLTLHGQIFIFALFVSPELVGAYFFALIIINSPIMLINAVFISVIFPDLTKLADNRELLSIRFHIFLKLFFALACVVSLMTFVISPWLIDAFWQGKWNQAIPLLAALVFIIPFWIAIDLTAQYISSLGRWKERFFILFGTAVIDMIVIFTTCSLLDFVAAIYFVVFFKIIYFEIIIRIFSFSTAKYRNLHSAPFGIYFVLALFSHYFEGYLAQQFILILSSIPLAFYSVSVYRGIKSLHIINIGGSRVT